MALHPDTDNNTTTNQPINQISLCRHRGNKRPISCQSASSDNGLRTNQLSVWIFWGNEQPISSLSGLHGVTAWPMSGVSSCTEGWASGEAQSAAQCCLPVPETGGEEPLQRVRTGPWTRRRYTLRRKETQVSPRMCARPCSGGRCFETAAAGLVLRQDG